MLGLLVGAILALRNAPSNSVECLEEECRSNLLSIQVRNLVVIIEGEFAHL